MRIQNVNKRKMSEEKINEQRQINLNEPLGSIGKKVKEEIRWMIGQGMSMNEVARRLRISSGQMSDLLNGNRPIIHLTIGTVDRMFDNANFNISNSFNTNSFNGTTKKSELIDRLITADLEPESLKKVLSIVREVM